MRTSFWLCCCAALAACSEVPPPAPEPAPQTLRVATYNTSLYDDADGGLIARLEGGDEAAARIAAVIQHIRPDVVLLNEFDYDTDERAAELFQRRYLESAQAGQEPIHYAYRYSAPVNTGEPSGLDLDGDGTSDGPNDAWGFGKHPGQYGMLVLSRFPIDTVGARSFRTFPWKDLPDARQPKYPAESIEAGRAYYPETIWNALRLSSKSHWDLPVVTPLGLVHLLASHPTPPVFDGPEDRNGARNHDEIRFWVEYLAQPDANWICDDTGQRGGLAADARFVILGDLNADAHDGDGSHDAIAQLIGHVRVDASRVPVSEGAPEVAKLHGFERQGDVAAHTGDFGPRVGTLRLDYALPSQGFSVRDTGVFWPKAGEPGSELVEASDHRMVWIDLANPPAKPQPR